MPIILSEVRSQKSEVRIAILSLGDYIKTKTVVSE